MNKKLLTIQVLKQRISNMQHQLTKLEKETTKPARSLSKSLSRSKNNVSSPIRKTSTNKRYKSPTFWTGNPVLGEQNPYFSQKNLSPNHKPSRNLSFTSKSPLQQKIMHDVDLSFYQSTPQNRTPQKENNERYESAKQCKGNFVKKNDSQTPELYRYIPKVQKVKTYDRPKKDPILNPQPPKISSKKITAPQCRSPKNMYIDNPNSNPNLYFNSTQPITLSPKANNNRNKSPGIKLLLSSSLQNLKGINQPQKTSGKKHYNRYFLDNFESKWNIHW